MKVFYSVRYKEDRFDVYALYFEEGKKGSAGWSLGGYGERDTYDEPDKFIEEKFILSRPIDFINLLKETDKCEGEVFYRRSQGLCFQDDDEMLKICVDILADKSIVQRVDIAKQIFRTFKPYGDQTSKIFENQTKIENLLNLKEYEIYGNVVEYLERKGKLVYEHEMRFDFEHIMMCYINNKFKLPNGYKFNIPNRYVMMGTSNSHKMKVHNLCSSSMYTTLILQVVSPAGVVLDGKDSEVVYEKSIYFNYHESKIGFKIDFKEIDGAINNEMSRIIAACKDFNTYSFLPRNYMYKLHIPVYKFNEPIRKITLNKENMDLIKESHKHIYNLLKKYNCIGVDYTFYNEVYYRKQNIVYLGDYYDGVSITVEFGVLTNGEYGLMCKRKSFKLGKIDVGGPPGIRKDAVHKYIESAELEEFIRQEILPISEKFKRDLYSDNTSINPSNYKYKKIDENFYKFLCMRYSNKNNACMPGEDEIQNALKERESLLKRANYDKEQRRLKEERRRQQQLAEEVRVKEEAELQDKKFINRILKLFGIKRT